VPVDDDSLLVDSDDLVRIADAVEREAEGLALAQPGAGAREHEQPGEVGLLRDGRLPACR
jgi:hypothetical protein